MPIISLILCRHTLKWLNFILECIQLDTVFFTDHQLVFMVYLYSWGFNTWCNHMCVAPFCCWLQRHNFIPICNDKIVSIINKSTKTIARWDSVFFSIKQIIYLFIYNNFIVIINTKGCHQRGTESFKMTPKNIYKAMKEI